jgi:hypothetical protein
MLCAYYDKSCDSESLFADLEIAKDPSFRQHLNKYNVIYLDMTWFIAYSEDIGQIINIIQEKVIEEICQAYPELKKQHSLSEILVDAAEVSGEKFIVIIDEWDALFREAKEDTDLQKEYILLLRGLFKSPFTDKSIHAAYITGILPIKKYGTQSAMTDFKEYSMILPEPLERYVGFTEEEVRGLAEQSGLSFGEVQHWYDGYVIGKGVHIYSPNSVMEAIERGHTGAYWTKTETYESLKIYIDMDFDGLKEAIVQMLGGAQCKIQTIGFRNDLTSIECKDDVLTLLVHLGYLAYNMEKGTVCIPNEEIRQEFLFAVERAKCG